jgi:phosphoribosylanthranilate isomerase
MIASFQRTRIKICGLKEVEHVDAAVSAGADAIGFVFYPPSVRAISVPSAQMLRARVPAFVSVVALFVNPTIEEVNAVIDSVRPDLLQFHGNETPAFCAKFSRPYLKAVAMNETVDLLDLRRRYENAVALLLDTPSAGHGGSGKAFDWSLLSAKDNAGPLVLSGGLNSANVHEAIARVRPYAVDVSSGVEAERGQKDSAKIHAFVRAVRDTDRALETK